MSTAQLESTGNRHTFETILGNALKLPGVRVNRNAFLSEAFPSLPLEKLNEVLMNGPVLAGKPQRELDKLASSIIMKRTLQSSGVSFAAGLPGGLAMAATIPADTMQFFCMALRLAQEVSYLYGADDLWRNGELVDEEMIGQFILYCGVMFGVSGSAAAVRVLSSAMAKQVAKKLPQKALTKTIYYPIIKKVATLLGVKMTKDTFAKGVSKAIPVIGGVVSGGITYASMRPMGGRLAKTLSEANFNYTEGEGSFLLDELYRDEAVCLYLGRRQLQAPSQVHIIVEHAVMGQGEIPLSRTPLEGVVVVVLLFTSLGGHPCMAHDGLNAIGDMVSESRQGPLEDAQMVIFHVSDAGGVDPSGLTLGGEDVEEPGLLPARKVVPVVDDPKETAHQRSSSISTGSFTYRQRSLRYCTSSGYRSEEMPLTKVVQERFFTSPSDKETATSQILSTSCKVAMWVFSFSVPRNIRNSTVSVLVRFTQVYLPA